MSLSKAFGAPVVLKYGEITYTFPMLTMRKVAKLSAVLSAKREARAAQRVKESGLSGEKAAKFRILSEESDVSLFDLWVWSDTGEGAEAVLTASLDGNPEAQAIIDAIPVLDAVNVARLVLGWQPPKSAEGEQPQNPTTEGASSGSETDASSSTSTDVTPGS